MKAYITLICSFLLLPTLANKPTNLSDIELQLFQKLAKEALVTKFLQEHPATCILAAGFCADRDCVELAQKAGLKIPVYLREQAFMRKIDHFLIIHEVNTDQAPPNLQYELMTPKGQSNTTKRINL
jgi:hypothetical protein